MKFDYEQFSCMVKDVADLYNKKFPYPFMYFDDLFDNELMDKVNLEIDKNVFVKDEREINNIEIKTRSDFEDNESIPPYSKLVFDVLNGGKFLGLVSLLTGINGLISDPYFDGGGINIIKNDGTLAVHVDGTTQHRMNICRRINAIVFLNDEWREDWNGLHEQWDFLDKNLSPLDENQRWCCVRKILPKKNRLLIFTTNDHSWHGHAGVLNEPKNIQRRSLITYYYTNGRPKSDLIFKEPHGALFINNNLTLTNKAFDDVEIIR
jgi:Rps23 Pro-64 3,4-dihydroxylase Tpa1-like proline 4-hydroxylase